MDMERPRAAPRRRRRAAVDRDHLLHPCRAQDEDPERVRGHRASSAGRLRAPRRCGARRAMSDVSLLAAVASRGISLGLVIGETVDRKYKLLRLLGEGGMGTVYEAEQVATLRHVAIKVIHPDLIAPGSEMAIRLRRESKAGGAITNEHIVELLDAGEDEDTGALYLVMEYLEGEDLQSLLDRTGPLRPDVALRVAGQALLGLRSAHEAGVIHRDIKPANLF